MINDDANIQELFNSFVSDYEQDIEIFSQCFTCFAGIYNNELEFIVRYYAKLGIVKSIEDNNLKDMLNLLKESGRVFFVKWKHDKVIAFIFE